MRRGEVYCDEQLAGVISETDRGFSFAYDRQYLNMPQARPVSLTLPLREEPFTSKVMFSFFDGLIPEGWLLDVALRNTDISILDRMSLLLLCCKECIGSVSVVAEQNEGGEV